MEWETKREPYFYNLIQYNPVICKIQKSILWTNRIWFFTFARSVYPLFLSLCGFDRNPCARWVNVYGIVMCSMPFTHVCHIYVECTSNKSDDNNNIGDCYKRLYGVWREIMCYLFVRSVVCTKLAFHFIISAKLIANVLEKSWTWNGINSAKLIPDLSISFLHWWFTGPHRKENQYRQSWKFE